MGGRGGEERGDRDRQAKRKRNRNRHIFGRTDGRAERTDACRVLACIYHSAYCKSLTGTSLLTLGGGDTYVNEITTKLHILGVVPLRSSPKRARVLYCPIKISVLFYLSCVLVFFNHAVNQLFKKNKKNSD